jgi:hypothetical protein
MLECSPATDEFYPNGLHPPSLLQDIISICPRHSRHPFDPFLAVSQRDEKKMSKHLTHLIDRTGKIWGQKDNEPINGFYPATQRRDWLEEHSGIIALLILVVSFFFYLYNIEGWLVNDDEGTCLYAVWRLSEGEIPYDDFLSAQVPIFLYIGAVIIKVFGASALVLRGTTATITVLAGFFIYLGVKEVLNHRVALLSMLLFVLHRDVYLNGRVFRADLYMLLFSVIGLYFTIIAHSRRRSGYLVIAGTLFSMAMFSKLFGALPLVGCVLFIFYRLLIRRSTTIKRALIESLLLLVPVLVGVVIIFDVSYLRWPYFFDSVFGHHLQPGRGASLVQVVLKSLQLFVQYAKHNYVFLLTLPVIIKILLDKKGLTAVYVLQLPTAVAFLFMSRFVYERHLLYLVPSLCTLVAYTIDLLSQQALSSAVNRKASLLHRLFTYKEVRFTFIILVCIAASQSISDIIYGMQLWEVDTAQLVEYITANTDESDHIFSDYANLNFYAHRPGVLQSGVLSSTEARSGRVTGQDLIAEIEAKGVKMVLLHVAGRGKRGFATGPHHLVNLVDYQDFHEYLSEHFDLSETFNRADQVFEIYRFEPRALGYDVSVPLPRIKHPAEINFDHKVMFLGYNVEEVVQKKQEPSWLEKYLNAGAKLMPGHQTTFRITYFWRCLEEMERDYTLVTQFEGHHGKTYRMDHSHQGVNGYYPTSMWRVGEVIKEEYQVEVPADYPPIRYALWVGVQDGEEGLEVVSDVEADEEDRVRLGEIEVLPAEEPSPLVAEPHPQNRAEVNINDELVFLGYDLSKSNPKPGDQPKVTTYWQSLRKTERDYAIQVELRNGGYKIRHTMEIAPTRLWEEGKYYRGDTVIAINPHLLGGTYSLNLGLERDDGTGTQVSLASLDIPYRRHIIRRWGKANYGESGEIIILDKPLSLRFHLREEEALELVAGWTGKAEGEETRVEVYITNTSYWRERYLGTWVIRSGRYMITKRRIPKSMTAPGQNVIELRVPEVRKRVHNVGWRGAVDRVFPNLLQDPRTGYDGPIQMDFAQVSTRWEGDWDNYYDLAEVYAERWMMSEVAGLYEEAVDKAVEPELVDEFALFKRAYRALGKEEKVEEIEELMVGRILYKMSVNLGGKVEFLGYSLTGLNNGRTQMHLFFRCVEEMKENYALWVHGEVEDESLLEEVKSDRGYAVFDHPLPTSKWEVGEVYEDDQIGGLRPGRYHFTLGLWRPEDGSRLWREDDPNAHVIDLGWVEVK